MAETKNGVTSRDRCIGLCPLGTLYRRRSTFDKIGAAHSACRDPDSNMSESEHSEQVFDESEAGLDDRSEELSERTEEDAQIRFYRAMADTEVDYAALLTNLARTVADVIFDFCVVYLTSDEQQDLDGAAAYHPHPKTRKMLQRTVIPPDEGVFDGLVNRVISRGENYLRPRWRPSLLQAYGTDPDGSPKMNLAIHSLIVVPMITTDGDCLGALLVGRHTTTASYDETDLALMEWIASHATMKLETAGLYRDLRQANDRLDAAVQVRDTFISIASHELRTPLSTLKLHAEMLRRAARRDDEPLTTKTLLTKLDSIDDQVDYLDQLLDQLLNVTRIIDGGLQVNYECCDLAKIVRGVARRFSGELEASGSKLVVACDDEMIGMWDRERLDHVATNLLSNAIKYGQGNPIRIRAQSNGHKAVLEVTDRGRGIAPEARDQIFERFERAVDSDDAKGLGLGLWIVSQYVRSLDGAIDVQSTPGEGSTFKVSLPLDPRPG